MPDQYEALVEMRGLMEVILQKTKDEDEFRNSLDVRQVGILDSLLALDDHDPVEGAKVFLYFHKTLINDPSLAGYFTDEEIDHIKAVATAIPVPPAEDA